MKKYSVSLATTHKINYTVDVIARNEDEAKKLAVQDFREDRSGYFDDDCIDIEEDFNFDEDCADMSSGIEIIDEEVMTEEEVQLQRKKLQERKERYNNFKFGNF